MGHNWCATLLQAKACMKEAEALGLELDVWSYSTLIKGFCQAERMRDAEDVLLAMKSHGVQPNVVSTSSQPLAVAAFLL